MYRLFVSILLSAMAYQAITVSAQDSTGNEIQSDDSVPEVSSEVNRANPYNADSTQEETTSPNATDEFPSNANDADSMGNDSNREDTTGTEAGSTDDAALPAAPTMTCSHNGNIRRVEVVYDNPDQAIPCRVLYNLETETPGDIQTLWSAQHTVGFCEEKAADLVASLEEGGWTCEPTMQ